MPNKWQQPSGVQPDSLSAIHLKAKLEWLSACLLSFWQAPVLSLHLHPQGADVIHSAHYWAAAEKLLLLPAQFPSAHLSWHAALLEVCPLRS